MADEPDPPRKSYEFKPKDDFDRTNVPSSTQSEEPTTVDEHLALAASTQPLAVKPEAAPVPKGPPSPDEIYAVLRRNVERDKAAGLYDLKPIVDTKKQQRKVKFWYPIIVIDSVLALVAFANRHDMDLMVVLFLSFGFLVNLVMVWMTWAFRTE